MNYSKQRELLLKILRGTKSHPTANELYNEMIKSDPKISLGTVYRNLALLSENGIIKRIDTEDNSVHYDGDVSRHYHFVCDKCARVFDIEYAEQTDIDREIEKKYGYTVSSHTLIFYGLCNDCKKD